MPKLLIQLPVKKPIRIIEIEQNLYDLIIASQSSYLNKNKNKINHFFEDSMKVPDVHRYNVEFKKGKWLDLIEHDSTDLQASVFNDLKIKSNVDVKTIVLLLESPHQDEFKNYVYKDKWRIRPIAPAQDYKKTARSTGYNIHTNLQKILEKIPKSNIKEGNYRVLICNLIPYQTSLHHFHGVGLSNKRGYQTTGLRNKVWETLWGITEISGDFKQRLSGYRPQIIINACTKELTVNINNFLIKDYLNITYCVKHPSAGWGKSAPVTPLSSM